MLAVFEGDVAPPPEGLKIPAEEENKGNTSAAGLTEEFMNVQEGAVSISLGTAGSLAYTSQGQNPLLPRLFAVVDDIFCLFEGHIENIAHLKLQYGLNKTANEVIIVIEAYRSLRDRGPYPAEQVMRDLNDSEDRLVFSDDEEIVKKGCGKSFAPFPKGCFFTTSRGLRSYEHPSKEVKPMPRVDSKGEVYGSTYKVDEKSKKDTSMPRVGSAADWSSTY